MMSIKGQPGLVTAIELLSQTHKASVEGGSDQKVFDGGSD